MRLREKQISLCPAITRYEKISSFLKASIAITIFLLILSVAFAWADYAQSKHGADDLAPERNYRADRQVHRGGGYEARGLLDGNCKRDRARHYDCTDERIKNEAKEKPLIYVQSELRRAYVTAYNETGNRTASGAVPRERKTIACSRSIKFGTRVIIYGREYTCEDRLAPRFDSRFDVYMGKDTQGAREWGKRLEYVTLIYE